SMPDVLAVCAVLVIGLLALYPTLGAEFVLVDDHEILSLVPALGAPAGSLPRLDPLSMAFVADPSVGRIRPLYWMMRSAEIVVLGDNAHAWHALMLVYGGVSALLLYAGARTLGASRLSAVLLGGWLLV